MNDKEVIKKFVEYLSKDYPGLTVDEWPDEVDSTKKEIDAVAGPFAIEHTSIDTLLNQRRYSAGFEQAVGRIENELAGKIPYYLMITIEYVHFTKKQDWRTIHTSLTNWIVNESPQLADEKHNFQSVQGIPFPFRVLKASNKPLGVYFKRSAPEVSTLSDRIRDQINRKSEKLLNYYNENHTTVLLLERSDILMDEDYMLNAIKEAFPNDPPNGIDEIWYADGFMLNDIQFMDFTPCLPCYLHQPDRQRKCPLS